MITQRQLVISEIGPCEGISYFALPKELRNPMKVLINIQNEDKECFKWCLVRYLNSVNKNPAKIRSADKKLVKKLEFKGVQFLVHKKDYPKIKKPRNISIDVFNYEDETTYHMNFKTNF